MQWFIFENSMKNLLNTVIKVSKVSAAVCLDSSALFLVLAIHQVLCFIYLGRYVRRPTCDTLRLRKATF